MSGSIEQHFQGKKQTRLGVYSRTVQKKMFLLLVYQSTVIKMPCVSWKRKSDDLGIDGIGTLGNKQWFKTSSVFMSGLSDQG